MKKVLFSIWISFLLVTNIYASEKIEVTLNKCVDGDTAWFMLHDEMIKVRFLAIDTPESTNKIEPFGKEASNYTCTLLTNAKKIEIEYDKNSEKLDKYNRHLAWIFVDTQLLQDLIIQEGLGEVKYLYGDYKYTAVLEASQVVAKTKKIGIWQDTNYTLYLIIAILIILFVIIGCIVNKKYRKKVLRKMKTKIKKEGKKQLKL